ncbi:MAG: glycosyltransferase family 39 protein [Acidimicrobiia bacterium]
MQVESRRRTPAAGEARRAIPDRLPIWAIVGIALTLATAVVLRFASRSDLWLDEALTVNISRLPLRDLPGALRHDGAPPMYYALLHGWMLLFGDGDFAVRALSGVIGVATLPAAYFAGLRLGGSDPERRRWVAWSLVLLVATSPFAVRYATEVRMYSLTILLVLLGYIAVLRVLDQPSLGRLACVSAVTAALLFTHYWSFFLLAVVGAVFVWSAIAGPADVRTAARRLVLALAVGGLCFIPWLPTLSSQLEHTGTPWADATISLSIVASTMSQFAGGRLVVGRLLLVVLVGLALFGVFARKRTNAGASSSAVRWVALVGVATLVLGLAVSYVATSTYQVRYAAVVFPFVLMVAAFGLTVVKDLRVRAVVLATAVVLGLVGGWRTVETERTQAGRVATAIVNGAQPGDVVGYCPDQLGPAVSRLLPSALGVRQYTFPGTSSPQRVDWVDYEERVAAADPAQFASALMKRAGTGAVWFVTSSGYRPFELRCETILSDLGAARGAGQTLVASDTGIFEHMGVVRFDH